MKIQFLSLADQDVDAAVKWYERQDEELSQSFLDDLDRVVRLVRIYPYVATELEPEIRRFLFPHFPYALIYGIEQETIVVLAVAHQQQEPRYWADRIKFL